jgi:hypothetical protein
MSAGRSFYYGFIVGLQWYFSCTFSSIEVLFYVQKNVMCELGSSAACLANKTGYENDDSGPTKERLEIP